MNENMLSTRRGQKSRARAKPDWFHMVFIFVYLKLLGSEYENTINRLPATQTHICFIFFHIGKPYCFHIGFIIIAIWWILVLQNFQSLSYIHARATSISWLSLNSSIEAVGSLRTTFARRFCNAPWVMERHHCIELHGKEKCVECFLSW